MKVITDKELDDTTVQIKCGENYGTAFLINENTAIVFIMTKKKNMKQMPCY